MAITREVKLICSDVENNNNKYWTGRLFDNGDVETEWGRVGVTKDSKLFQAAGERFLDKKISEKQKKGYQELKLATGTISEGKLVANNDLKVVAYQQIKVSKPELEQLIDRLVQENVHRITSSTQIAFDNSSGLFSTPLGIVTQEAITEARDLLATIHKGIKQNKYDDKTLLKNVSSYLMLVPQNVGMKLKVQYLFPDSESVLKQNDILDSLESSLLALKTQPKTTTKPSEVEKVFDVALDLEEKGAEIDRINKYFRSTAHNNHISNRLKIHKVYRLVIAQMREAFEKEGVKIGNVKELWHGTKAANLLSILKSGLKVSPPSTAAIAGKMFGNGIYFSDQSTKSLNYAYGYWDGKYQSNCFMLLNDVAMGKEYVPSTRSMNFPVSGYDSVFAKAGHSGVMNNEMIVYSDCQVNIKFLIEFQE
jgi:poly [ADP-ribose] polymerase